MSRRIGLAFAAAGVFLAAASAETLPQSLTAKIDAVFAKYDRRDSPGCSLAALHDGAIVYAHGYGMASLESGTAITPQTVFDIGSTAKQFTAAAIVLLEGDGKLSFDDDVRTFIPELPSYGSATVTLRNLMQHTGGLPDYIELLRLAGTRTEDVATDEEALHLLSLQRTLEFLPGSAHVYSNSGYFLLSLVVQKASGQSLRDFARERIFSPLGMTHTQYVHDHRSVVPGRATGYAQNGDGSYRLESSLWEQNGDGGILTTVEDLSRWDENFYKGKVGGSALIDRLQAPAVLTTGETLPYGLGLRVDRYRGLRRVRHGGAWAGFRAELLRFPEKRFSVVTLCNLANARASKLADQVADLSLEKEFTQPARSTAPAPLPRTDITRGRIPAGLAGTYWSKEADDILRIADLGERLRVRHGQDEKDELVFAETDRFQSEDGRFQIAFRKSAHTRPEVILSESGGTPVVYEPVDPWSPRPSELSAYAGDYRCPALETVYSLTASDGRLLLSWRNGRREVVKPVFSDTFESDFAGLLHFTRAGARFSGFQIRSGRTTLSFQRGRWTAQ